MIRFQAIRRMRTQPVRLLLVLLLAGLCARVSAQDEAPEAAALRTRPNVVLLIIDTTRADRLGCYGYDEATSPGLDKYAAQGVLFESVLAQCTWTRPSHASFLTSRYPRSVGVYVEKDEILDDRFETVAEVLQANGYRTLGLTANPNINTVFNFQQGFDAYVDSNVVWGWMEAKDGAEKRSETTLPAANALFDRAMELIQDAPDPAAPHYLQINVMEPHEWSRKRTVNMLRDDYAAMKFKTPMPFGVYDRLLRQVTDDVDAFVQRLQALPGWEDTLFVFVSDHGDGLDSHPNVANSKHHGRQLYESQALVPWIMYRQGWEPALRRVPQQVRLLEVMPTLLDLLAISLPEGLDGRSMLPVLRGDATRVDLPEFVPVESYFSGSDQRGIYGDKFLYVENAKPLAGMDAREVQVRGQRQDGARTNQINKRDKAAKVLGKALADFEAAYPKVAPSTFEEALSQEEIEQLEAIGYLGDDNEDEAADGG